MNPWLLPINLQVSRFWQRFAAADTAAINGCSPARAIARSKSSLAASDAYDR